MIVLMRAGIGLVATAALAIATSPAQAATTLQELGTYATDVFDEGATEIVAYDPATKRLFSTNGDSKAVDVLDISDPTDPTLLFSIDLTPFGDGPTSVTVANGLVAVAVPADPVTDPGKVVLFDTDGNLVAQVQVGALPDMVTFAPGGRTLLVANEGEPDDGIDPEGSVSIITLYGRPGHHFRTRVCTAGFQRFNDVPLDPSIIIAPGIPVAQDLEPEYITVEPGGRTAYVSLQENNALGRIDVRRCKVKALYGLRFKDHSIAANALDASDEDGEIHIATWPAFGMIQPDSIASYRVLGKTYIVTANEGDARDDARVKNLDLDPAVFTDPDLQEDEHLGRLQVNPDLGDADGDGLYEALYAFGARSFSIYDSKGRQVFDSGDDFERITAAALPDQFNSDNNDNDSFDSRSDAKGPEPEALALGRIGFRTYAFIGLERIGGIMTYDITRPQHPVFCSYVNNRDFTVDADSPDAGDLAPEGIAFIPRSKSPIKRPLLAVANEVSGTVTLYAVKVGRCTG